MKVTVLSAMAAAKGMKKGEGQSFLIRSGDRSLLYGFGADETAMENMARLRISPDVVDTGFLASGLPADAGGLIPFMRENRRADIYARVNAFDPRYKKGLFGLKDISPDKRLRSFRRILRCKNYFAEKDGSFVTFSLSAEDGAPSPAERTYYRRDEEGRAVRDDFTHEMYLLVRGADKRWTLFCGDAHAGLASVVRNASALIGRSLGGTLAAVVGGMYMPDGRDMPAYNGYIDEAADALVGSGARFYAGNETGVYARTRLSIALGEKFGAFAAGETLEL